jgi:hypothetical protein
VLFKIEEEDEKARDKERKTGRHAGVMVKPKGFRIVGTE